MVFDCDIPCWSIEFLLRQPAVPDIVLAKILSNIQLPVSQNNPRFQKTLLLRSIDAEISGGTVSESVLESLELIEQLDRRSMATISDSMKSAYCAAAVECTVKYLVGLARKDGGGKYFEAVERIWRERVGNLVAVKSELVTEELSKCREELEAAVWSLQVRKSLMERNTRNDALRLIAVYLEEAMAMIGPSLLENAIRSQTEWKGKENGNKNEGSDNVAMEMNLDGGVLNVDDNNNKSLEFVAANSRARERKAIGKKKILHKPKHVSTHKWHTGPCRVSDFVELETDMSSTKYNILSSPEVSKVQEALKASSKELQAVDKDPPLPDALLIAGTVTAEIGKRLNACCPCDAYAFCPSVDASTFEMAGKVSNCEPAADNHNGKAVNNPGQSANAAISEISGEIGNYELCVENKKGKGGDGSNLSSSYAADLVKTKEDNPGVLSCNHPNNDVPKPSLMEQNRTARTFEWDDTVDGSPEPTNNKNRFFLESPKRKVASPLPL